MLDKMNASKGTEEYRVGEIFLSATPGNRSADARQRQQDPRAAARTARRSPAMRGNIRKPRPPRSAATSAGSARSSCPPPLADRASRRCAPGTISNPIPVPGGVSIIAVQDTRKILTADPRDAVLSLKQVSVSFPKGTTRARPSRSSRASPRRRGTSAAAAAPTRSRPISTARSSSSDQVKMRDLPPALQQMMLPMQVGQATQPFGSLEEGVRVLVDLRPRRGRPSRRRATTTSTTSSTKSGSTSRARRYLRDLRRDAVIEFR